MAEQLQDLIDRIQKEGVDKAEKRAAAIIDEAREKAAVTLKETKAKAIDIVKKAEQDAALFEERARKSLEQASRDILLSVNAAISSTFDALIRAQVDEALSSDTVKQLVPSVIQHYLKDPDAAAGGIQILLGENDCGRIRDYLLARFAVELRKGLSFGAESGILSGFYVSVQDGRVIHDFSGEAIASAISQLVQPKIAAIVTNAAAPNSGKDEHS